MDTMEITKYVGAICGSLLALLLIGFVAHEIYYHEEEGELAYSIPLPEGGEGEAEGEPAEAVDMAALMASADPAAGETVFRRCASCHAVDGTNKVGPYLDGVVGREIAGLADFSYSGALAGIEGAWDYDHLSAFLENPRGYAPGTAMQFAGLPDPQDRANLIAWLEAQ